MRQIKQLQDENGRLKRLVAELTLDKTMLQDVLAKMYGPPRDCKEEMSREKQSAKMYPAFLWSGTPGHDENPRTSVLLNLYGLAGPLFCSGLGRAVRLFGHPRILHSRLDGNACLCSSGLRRS